MLLGVVILVIAIGLVALNARREQPVIDAIDDRRIATAAELGLEPTYDGWEGEIDGRRVSMHASRGEAFRRHDEIFAPSPASNHFARQLTFRIEVRGAPPDLAFGPDQPLLKNRARLGHDEFDRRFAVRDADPTTLGWLDERRRQVLIDGHPLIWMADATLIVFFGALDEDDPAATVGRAVAAAGALE